jgi:hypothetical protein
MGTTDHEMPKLFGIENGSGSAFLHNQQAPAMTQDGCLKPWQARLTARIETWWLAAVSFCQAHSADDDASA